LRFFVRLPADANLGLLFGMQSSLALPEAYVSSSLLAMNTAPARHLDEAFSSQGPVSSPSMHQSNSAFG